MPTPLAEDQAIPSEIRGVLRELQSKIRRYVCLEGLAIGVIWIGLTFWAGLALDYLPVLAGANEMPRWARGILLATIAIVLAYILYRWVLRRTLVKFRDSSMAVLLERHFPQLGDALVTTVELSNHTDDDSPLHSRMLIDARERAINNLADVRLSKVFNLWPLWRNLGGAVLLLASLIAFGLFASDAFARWTSRLYRLSDDPWPRRAFIEVLGFADGHKKIAKGDDFTVRVRADANRESPPPEVCTIYYHTEAGERGRVHMNKQGASREGYQYYTFDGKPFKSVLSNIEFDVVGMDYRVRDRVLEVVPSPKIVDVQLHCELPAYTGLLPKSESYHPGIQLPLGSKVKLSLTANKPLNLVTIIEEDAPTKTLDFADEPAASFDFDLGTLDNDRGLNLELVDSDQVSSQTPYRIAIAAIKDEPPIVDVRFRGIGSAITQDARIPVVGHVRDDFGVARSWFRLTIPDSTSPSDHVRELPLDIKHGEQVDSALDLRTERTRDDNPWQLEIETNVSLVVQAADRYDLDSGPNIGSGDEYDLEVVTPSRLLALLEARELDLRRRFEQIVAEMTESRDSLLRVTTFGESTDDSQDAGPEHRPQGAEPEDNLNQTKQTQSNPDSEQRFAQLIVQRASQHSQRAAQEVLGVALSFDDICQELINNRVDSEERKNRLQRDIANPLKFVAETLFPEYDQALVILQKNLGQPNHSTHANKAVGKAEEILAEMEKVLEKMIELQDYNELVDLVRSLLDEQQALEVRTRKEQRQQALDLLK